MSTLYRFILINLIALGLLSACFFDPLPFDEKKWLETIENTDAQDVYKENAQSGVYFNPWLIQENRSFFRFLRWRLSKTPGYSEMAKKNRPAVIPDLMKRIKQLDQSVDFIAWIGHATFLFRINGVYWLTDPMFSERALVPKRLTPPAIQAAELTDLRAPIHVVISHNHYDHLDKSSIHGLPKNSLVYVPLGLGDYVSSIASGSVTEMNWWDELEIGNGITLTCLPAQHWSLRLFQGYNTTLWASFMVSSPGQTVYFGGDSGYFKGYGEIGKKFNSIDYALLPITAYDPRWFMHYPHMNTAEAIRAFLDLKARYFIPTQWGTFRLGDNPSGLPPLDLRRDIDKMGLNPEAFLILDIGEIRIL